MSGFAVPDKISPEIGWRVWLVVRGNRGLKLHSAVHAKVEWPPRRELVAECRRTPSPEASGRAAAGLALSHASPEETCGAGGGHGCGIYAAREPEECTEYLEGCYSPVQVLGAPVVHRVIGRVALWGKVIEGERGWRGERAYPVEIWIPSLQRVTSGSRIGALEPPSLPPEVIATGLAGYGVPVKVAGEDAQALAA